MVVLIQEKTVVILSLGIRGRVLYEALGAKQLSGPLLFL